MEKGQSKLIQDFINRILKQSSFISKNDLKAIEYVQFWTYLHLNNQSAESPTLYVQEIIRLLLQFEKDKTLITKGFTIENLLCTLFTISVYQLVEIQKVKKVLNEMKVVVDQLQLKSFINNSQQKVEASISCPYSHIIMNDVLNFHFDEEKKQDNQFISAILNYICFLPDINKYPISNQISEQQLVENLNAYYSQVNAYQNKIRLENRPYYANLIEDDLILKETGEFSYSYDYLLQWLNTKNININPNLMRKPRIIPSLFLEQIIRMLRLIPFISKKNPNEAEKSALALLHLIKQIFTFYSTLDMEYMKQLMSSIEKFRRWRFPVGLLAQELVTLIYSECKSPGNAFRIRIRQEIPCIDTYQEINDQIKPSLGVQTGQNQNFLANQDAPQQELYCAYIILDYDDQIEELDYMMQYGESVYKNCKIKNAHYLRSVMSSNMINIGKFAEQSDEISGQNPTVHYEVSPFRDFNIASNISQLTVIDTFKIYGRMLNILEKCENLNSIVDVRLIQGQALQDIVVEIIEKLKEQLNQGQSQQFGGQSQIDYQMRQTQQIDLKLSSQQLGQMGREYPFSTSISNVISENTLTYIFEFPKICLKPIVNLKNRDYGKFRPQEEYKLEFKLHGPSEYSQIYTHVDSTQGKNPLYQQPLRYVLFGGDLELHNLVQELGEIFQDDYRKFLSLNYRVYLVPNKPCCLSRYIASKDPWYQRYLYIPFREDLLLPRLETCADRHRIGQWSYELKQTQLQQQQQAQAQQNFQLMNDKLKTIMLPYELKMNLMLTYIREAQRNYNIYVYQIDCEWVIQKMSQSQKFAEQLKQGKQVQQLTTNNTTQNVNNPEQEEVDKMRSNQSLSIFFCQYLEIGAPVEAEIIRNNQIQQRKTQNVEVMNYIEMREKGILKFQYYTLRIKATSMDILGNPWKEEEVILQINSLHINNVYKDYFMGNMPQPHEKWLELAYLTYDNSRLFEEQLQSKTLFKTYNSEQLQYAFKSLFVSLPVLKVEITEVQGKSFKMIVDGKISDELKKITIQPATCKHKNSYFFTLPIMTFLPLKP